MGNRLVTMLLVGAAALSICGCGSSSATKETEQPEQTQQTQQTEDAGEPADQTQQAGQTQQTTANDDVWALITSVSQGVEPTQLSGDGDDVVDLPYPGIPVLLDINCDAGGYFGVKALDSSGNEVTLYANEAGTFHGTVTTYEDFRTVKSLQVEADGPWTIDVKPLDQVRHMSSGEVLTGDSVVYIDAPGISKITLDCPGDGYFGARAFGLHDSALLANEVAPYSGTKAWSEPQFLMVVQADGDWSATW